MNDLPSNVKQASTGEPGDPETIRRAERESLIDDLAFLVVRQHRRQQPAGPESDPIPNSGEPEVKTTTKSGIFS